MNKLNSFKCLLFVFAIVVFSPVSLFASNNCNLAEATNITITANTNSHAAIQTAGGTTAGYTYSCGLSSIFCISPQLGSVNGMDYGLENTGNYDISNCTNSKDSSSTFCGMAAILQEAYKDQFDVGNSIPPLANGALDYSKLDGAITLSLRLWAAQMGNDSFDDSKYDHSITKAANYIWDTVNSGGTVDTNELKKYFPAITDDSYDVIQLAVKWFGEAAKGVDIARPEDIFTEPSITVNDNGSVSYEYPASSVFNNITGVSVDGASSDLAKVVKTTCSDGSGECVSIEIDQQAYDSFCKDNPEGTFKIKVSGVSDSSIDKMHIYKPNTNATTQWFIGFDSDQVPTEIEVEQQCHPNLQCVMDEETGICYGPNGEMLDDCSQMAELCGPCEIEDGVCTRNGEVVDCAECDVCVKEGDNCFIAGNQVPCEGQSPECVDVCFKVGDECYVGDQTVNCEDYPECSEGICTRDPGSDICKINGIEVECDAYEECSDFVCHKEGDICYLGEGANKKIVPCGSYPDPECQVDDDDNPDSCPVVKIDDVPYYSCKYGDTEGELADPPMCTILKNNIRAAYKIDEYSNEWCDVYCRETYSFKFMDKETVQSGRYFRHDVESKYVTISNLSTVVTATQQCTSLINYDDWKEAYIAANSNVRTAFNELKYWESLYELNNGQPTEIVDCGGGASGCDNCKWDDVCGDWQLIWQTGHYAQTDEFAVPNQTTAVEAPAGEAAQCPHNVCSGYDSEGKCVSYVCTGTSKGPAKTVQQARGIDRDYVIKQHEAAVNAYNSALDNRNALIYKLFNCNFFDDSEVNKYFKDPKTYYTSKFASNHSVSPVIRSQTYHDILLNYEPNSDSANKYPKYDDQTGTNGAGSLKDEGSAYNVAFDKDIQPALGTEGIEENKGYKTSAESNNPEDPTVCGGCSDPIDNSLSDTPKSATADPYDPYGVLNGEEYGFWVCYDSLTGAHCDWEVDRLVIPYNYVANLEVTREIGYWQNTRFSTEIFTGKVVEGSGGLQLPEKTWPVAISTLTGDYNIFLRFEKFGDIKRKQGTLKLEFNDDVNCAYAVVNEMTKYDCDDGYHECYDCDDPSTPENECYPSGTPGNPGSSNLDLGFYFRSIDLTDIFPNSVYSPNNTLLNPNRPIGSNWSTTNAIQVISKIQDLGNGYLGVDKEPEYSITLTPTERKQIAKNSKEIYKGNYLDASTLSCNQSTAICQSTWLRNDLINILSDYNHEESYIQNENSRNNLYVVGRN